MCVEVFLMYFIFFIYTKFKLQIKNLQHISFYRFLTLKAQSGKRVFKQ